MQTIIARDNAKIKELTKLCASRRARRESGRFVLEGARLVLDALQSGIALRSLFVTDEGIRRTGEQFSFMAGAAGDCFLIDESVARRIAQTESPQGVFALCEGSLLHTGLPEAIGRGCLLLASLQDPGNVGTILRSADAFGLSAVILTDDCPDPASPKVLRASMGAALRLPIFCAESAAAALDALRARGIPVYAAALSKQSVPLSEAALPGSVVVIGNEGAGLPDEVAARCDKSLHIPISQGCESLNAAMAATIFAWELSKGGGEST